MSSPTQTPIDLFSELENESSTDADFAHEINDKMRVPKCIKGTGEYTDDDLLLSNQSELTNSWNYHEEINMKVPKCLLAVGSNHHVDTYSIPSEFKLENSFLPKFQTNPIIVQTPPRTITLTDYYMPTDNNRPNVEFPDNGIGDGDDENRLSSFLCPNNSEEVVQFDGETYLVPHLYPNKSNEVVNVIENDMNLVKTVSQATTNCTTKQSQTIINNDDDNSTSTQLANAQLNVLALQDELIFLRHRVAKLEEELQKERTRYVFGFAVYFVLKAIFWLTWK